MAEEAALAAAEKEKAKCKAALEAAEAAKRIAALEAKRRMNAEMRALEEAEERKHALTAFAHGDLRYRRYTIEEIEAATDQFSESRKIGEGGYGPVYMCELDHTPVAVKVLRPDAAQGRSQFQQEVWTTASIIWKKLTKNRKKTNIMVIWVSSKTPVLLKRKGKTFMFSDHNHLKSLQGGN